MRVLLFLFMLTQVYAGAAFGAADRTGRVAHVVDGHTLDVLLGQKRIRISLAGVAAPVQSQRHALRSRQSLIAICGGEVAALETRSTDRNGRTLAKVTCSGTDAGAEQVRRGMAWAIEGDADSRLHALQEEAKAARRGLWADLAPASAQQMPLCAISGPTR